MTTWAVILCAGRSTRMGLNQNKTLLSISGVPAFVRCIMAFRPFVDGICLVTAPEEKTRFEAEASKHDQTIDLFAQGGAERRDSVLNALQTLPSSCDQVLIHDGARCFITAATIQNVLTSLEEHGSGVPAIPARDTIKEAESSGLVLRTLDRSRLRIIQTPQGFRRSELLEAYTVCGELQVTDDASLMEAAGKPVYLVPGDESNLKLTYKEDLKHMHSPIPRIGQGYDAHRLVEDRKLILCGVDIPWQKGLLGHSDADVALHALMDALLGAAALGDIGHLFPDNDERYRGISSMLLLKEVWKRLKEAGYAFGNADVTIIAQQPKLAPYIDQMRLNIAEALETEPSLISVKATTTEKMGYEGRGEGISASAVALLFKAEQ